MPRAAAAPATASELPTQPINLTPAALEHLKKMRAEVGGDELLLRVGVKQVSSRGAAHGAGPGRWRQPRGRREAARGDQREQELREPKACVPPQRACAAAGVSPRPPPNPPTPRSPPPEPTPDP
jgi:hypothetical protein